ncbi:dGTP triphosphohydrolase [Clostridium diolis]|uniref:HD domain-containing protein n=1 Tax=Clostridium diolis TaxID=223919 RepID=A0AAV3VYK3_9CLOT|nr:dNTP triphosphohydrolase [Clostridium diolis]GEA30327.1 hypothetical protein CDIOL_12500 [Clostridium diolis]
MYKKYAQIFTNDSRPIEEEDNSMCKGFAHDIEKIIFCKSFRRLEHKAQIYSHEKGDHFRTRLTHTLEVSQIARILAQSLNVNAELAEAISLGHDVGHTPFGHQGERTIDDIMSGKDNLDCLINCQTQFRMKDEEEKELTAINGKINFGGFKHNYNSLRILDCMESSLSNKKGLNLCWQVIEGILKHTKINVVNNHKEYDVFDNFNKKINDIDICRFLSKENLEFYKNKLHLELAFSVTIEGQIACIADEIAQLQHDLDDGFRDKELKLDVIEIIDNITETLKSLCDKYENAKEESCLENIRKLHKKLKEHGEKFDSKNENEINYLIEHIRYFFLNDVLEYSKINVSNLNYEEFKDSQQVFSKVIDFSPAGKELSEKIKDIIGYSILNSYSVTRFDLKAKRIVRELFKAYYENPLLMPKNVLSRILDEVQKNQKRLYPIKFKFPDIYKRSMISLDDINFDTSDKYKINLLLSVLKLELFNIRFRFYFGSDTIYESEWNNFYLTRGNHDKCRTNLKAKPYDFIKDTSFYGIYSDESKLKTYKDNNVFDWAMVLFKKCLIENHFVYLSSISDYISGMTDNFAKAEYESIYLISK